MNRWTTEEDEVIISMQNTSIEDIMEALSGRTRNAVKCRVQKLKKQGNITVQRLKRRVYCDDCSEPIYQSNGGKVMFCDKCKLYDTCIHCGGKFEVVLSKKGVNKFCSEKCRHAKPEYHPMFGKKHAQESIVRMSENNYLKKLKESGKEIPSVYLKGLKEGQGWLKGKSKLNNEVLAERAIYLSKLYKGKSNPEHSKRMKEYYAKYPEKHPNRILANKKVRTYIEQVMYDKLLLNNISFEEQYRILNYYADFALHEYKLIIECDGEYWHDAERDRIRDEKINKEGWKVVRFTGSEICKNPDKCIDELKRLIS